MGTALMMQLCCQSAASRFPLFINWLRLPFVRTYVSYL